MHRTFDPGTRPFDRPPEYGLYAVTLLCGGLLLADLWPPLAGWLTSCGLDVPTFTGRELFGVRLALAAAVVGGTRALVSAIEGLSSGVLGADLAVAVACVAAVLLNEPVVAAEVVAIGLVGEVLEAFTFERTRRAVRGLNDLFPHRTWVLRDGAEVRALTSDVVPGDTVVVKPGGKVPADGVVHDGTSTVDTAALTGESEPRGVGPGDRVLAGFINHVGALTVRVEKVAAATVAGRVIAVTAEALKQKAPIERTADRLAKRFLPAVLALAALAFLFNCGYQLWFAQAATPPTFAAAARMATYPALAVLVVACPCPLVLATPAAVVAALGRLAGTGILVKGGAALERLAGATAFAFDKTGTLTEGQPEVKEIRPAPGRSRDDVLRLAAAAERGSEHPLARAILAALPDPPSCSEFAASPGGGVAAVVEGAAVIAGSPAFLRSRGVGVPDEADVPGQTTVAVAAGGTYVGCIGLTDTVRPNAAGVIAELRSLGLSPIVVLTGDRRAAADAAVGTLPVDAVYAELLPEQKLERLPPGAAYVGDGINDAPALARAAVGLAVGGGTDVAAEAGDVILMGDPLKPLPLLVKLSRETVAVIRQNITWFGYGVNAVGVLAAGFVWPLLAPTGAWYEAAPLAGVLYHQLGSLLVLLNSMRLLAFDRTPRLTEARHRAARLDPDELLHGAAHHAPLLLRGAAALGLLAWVLTSLVAVEPHEVAVVRRFGAPVADLSPGLHLRWPWPVETATRVAPNEVRTVEVGFRTATGELLLAKRDQEKLRRPGATWTSGHADATLPVPDEALVPTGDGNLVEVLATVRYTAADPRAFLFGSADPSAAVRTMAEAALREQAASAAFLSLLTTDRSAFAARAEAVLANRLAAAGGLGVRLEGLTVHDLHPPQEVVPAYHAVASAIQTRDKLVNEAEAEATRTRRRAEETRLRVERRAAATAVETKANAAATRDVVRAWTVALAGGRRELTEFRLTLQAVTAALAGRDKVLIDAADVPGRRQLLFGDFAGSPPPLFARPGENKDPAKE